jgi:predicted N-acetyltransferase YhbS
MSHPNDDLDDLPTGTLETDAVIVRQLAADDFDDVVRIDRSAMGRAREEYYRTRFAEALEQTTLRTSLVAELDGRVVGFVIARLFYGEFGRTDTVAVIDSIGVEPAMRGKHVGQALMRQLQMNLRALRVDHVETQVDWDRFEMVRFLQGQGFHPVPRLSLRLELADAPQ